MDGGEQENVIYVQVDEHGRVINYTSNMPGGEQVILLQEGDDVGSQQLMLQPELLAQAAQQAAIISEAPSAAQAGGIVVSSDMQQTGLEQQTIYVDEHGNPIQSTGILEQAGAQIHGQATIMDQSGAQILVADESQIPVMMSSSPVHQTVTSPKLMTSSQPQQHQQISSPKMVSSVQPKVSAASSAAGGPVILSSEQAQILIAGAQQQHQPVKRGRPSHQASRASATATSSHVQIHIPQATFISSSGQMLVQSQSRVTSAGTRSLITDATRSMMANKNPRLSSPPAPQRKVGHHSRSELVSGGLLTNLLTTKQKLGLNFPIQKKGQPGPAPLASIGSSRAAAAKEKNFIEATDNAIMESIMNPTSSAEPDASKEEPAVMVQPQIKLPPETIKLPSESIKLSTETETLAVDTLKAAEDTISEVEKDMLEAAKMEAEGKSSIVETPAGDTKDTSKESTEEATPSQSQLGESRLEMPITTNSVPLNDIPIQNEEPMDTSVLNGDIFANDDEETASAKEPELLENKDSEPQSAEEPSTSTVAMEVASDERPKQPEEVHEKSPRPAKQSPKPVKQDFNKTVAKIMELSTKFDTKVKELEKQKHIYLQVTKPVLTDLPAERESTIVRNRLDDDEEDDDVAEDDADNDENAAPLVPANGESDEDGEIQFKPRAAAGLPKKTYEGFTGIRKRNSTSESKDLDNSIAERRGRRKTKPIPRDDEGMSVDASTTENEDTEEENLLIEDSTPKQPVKRGRGRPRKNPLADDSGSPKPSTSKALPVSSPKLGRPKSASPKPASPKPKAGHGRASTPKTNALSPKRPGTTEKRGRGRPRKSGVAKAATASPAAAGSSKEQQPDVTSSSDQYQDADPEQKSFMANFKLMTAAQKAAREEENKKRRSKRVSIAEKKAAETDDKEEEPSAPKSAEKRDNIFDILSPAAKRDPISGEIQSLREDVDDLKDVNSQLLSKLSSGEESGASGDAKVMQNKIQKLQTVNAELKTRLRMYETKSASSKFQERNEIKTLQAKVEKLNTHNMDLKGKIDELEHRANPLAQTVDKKGVVSKLKSQAKHITPKTEKASTKRKSMGPQEDLAAWEEELRMRGDALDKKEQKLKVLDRELDERTAMLRAAEGKVARSIQQMRTKEKELEYREKQLLKKQSGDVKEKKPKKAEKTEDSESQLELREIAIEEKERELEEREQQLGETEGQLEALKQELNATPGDKLNTTGDLTFDEVEDTEISFKEIKKTPVTETKKKPIKTPVQTPGSVKRGRGRPKKSESLKSTPSSSKKTTPTIAKEKKLSLPLMKKTPKATPEHITVANLKAKEPRRSVGRPKKYSPSPDPVARRISRTAVDKAKNVLKAKNVKKAELEQNGIAPKIKTPSDKETPKAKKPRLVNSETPKTPQNTVTPKSETSNKSASKSKTPTVTPRRSTELKKTPKSGKKTPVSAKILKADKFSTKKGRKSAGESLEQTLSSENKEMETPTSAAKVIGTIVFLKEEESDNKSTTSSGTNKSASKSVLGKRSKPSMGSPSPTKKKKTVV